MIKVTIYWATDEETSVIANDEDRNTATSIIECGIFKSPLWGMQKRAIKEVKHWFSPGLESCSVDSVTSSFSKRMLRQRRVEKSPATKQIYKTVLKKKRPQFADPSRLFLKKRIKMNTFANGPQ